MSVPITIMANHNKEFQKLELMDRNYPKPDPNRDIVGDPPAIGADFDATPELVRKIEIDQTVMLGDPNRHVALGTVELGLCLQHVESGAERGRSRRIPCPFVILLP